MRLAIQETAAAAPEEKPTLVDAESSLFAEGIRIIEIEESEG